jgi:hydroxymethylbilane synthase
MQTEQAGEVIRQRTGASFELAPFKTSGDEILGDLKQAGGKGHFVKDIERALARGDIDLAIHCLKDMPGNEPDHPELVLAAFLPREDVADVFVSRSFERIEALPVGACVGTSSPRRAAQVKALRSDLRIVENFRGTIDTRARKALSGEVDATLLAIAGLNRVGAVELTRGRLDPAQILPALGQGTLALQCRASDEKMIALCRAANDPDTEYASVAERACLRLLDGDCYSAIAGWCAKWEAQWRFVAAVYAPDGAVSVERAVVATQGESAAALGSRMADALLSGGAAALLASARPPLQIRDVG